jgi:flagellar hook-basal body complex protein FliE
MPLPQNQVDNINGKISSLKGYKEVQSGVKQLQKKGNSFQDAAKNKAKSVTSAAKDASKQFQQQAQSQLEQILQLITINTGQSSATVNELKNIFNKVVISTYRRIPEILFEEAINAIGCSQQQEYQAQTLYIKVQSIDLQKMLLIDPNDTVGISAYEKQDTQVGEFPFAMNRQLYNLLQTEGVPLQSYLGFSGQDLFDIEYVTTDNNGNFGDFYKVTLKNRLFNGVQGPNRVGDFLIDYYKSIKVFEIANVYAQVMEQLTNCLSIDLKIGSRDIEVKSKFALILQRILGLCFDNTNEIDVGGTAKVSASDAIDNSFFSFNEVDLRQIDQRISNVFEGIVEFESCEGVKLPVDTQMIFSQLNAMSQTDDTNEQLEIANSLTDNLIDAWKFQLKVPTLEAFNISLNLDFIKTLPKAVCMAILSPKVILPIMIMIKSLQQELEAYDLEDFAKKFKKFIINFMSKLGALFVEELMKILRKEIRKLVASIVSDINDERVNKAYLVITSLIEILQIIISLIRDFRSCKSIIDEILALLKLAGNLTANQLPFPLAFGASLRSGTSAIRSFTNTIENLQQLGIPTGPMPDGSPNLGMIAILQQLKGTEKESAQNSKTTTAVGPLTVLPTFTTQPSQVDGLIQ